MKTMTAEEAAEWGKTLDFPTVWAALMADRERMEESHRKFEEEMKKSAERQKEADRRREEENRELKEAMRKSAERLDQQLGKLGNRFGEMVEYMVKPCLLDKFRELGFVFEKAFRDMVIKDRKNNIITEADFILENGDKVMIVEIKSKPTTNDILEHIERMEKIRAHANLHHDNRKYLGAIGGMVVNENEKTFALKNGFYAIEPSGETFNITVPEGIYSVREW